MRFCCLFYLSFELKKEVFNRLTQGQNQMTLRISSRGVGIKKKCHFNFWGFYHFKIKIWSWKWNLHCKLITPGGLQYYSGILLFELITTYFVNCWSTAKIESLVCIYIPLILLDRLCNQPWWIKRLPKDLSLQFHLPSSFANHHWTKEGKEINKKTIIYLRN